MDCTEVTIEDSSKVTVSPTWKLFAFKGTYPISVAEGLVTICATALLFLPIIFSPIIAFTSNPKPLTNWSVFKVGVNLFKDSYTFNTFTTSGVFKDISLSSTLKP